MDEIRKVKWEMVTKMSDMGLRWREKRKRRHE